MHKKIAVFLFFLSLSGFALGQENYSFSLQQAVAFSLNNQLNVQNAQYDEQIAHNKVREILGLGLPQLNGSFDAKDFIEIPTSLLPGEFFGAPPGAYIPVKFGVRYNVSAGVEASQLVFDGTYLVGIQASKVYMELAQKAMERTKEEVIVSVTKAYYSVLVNEERMKLIETHVARLQKLSDDTKALYENGFVEKVDLDRVTVAFNNIELEKKKMERLLQLGYVLLKYQMGMKQDAALSLTDKLDSISLGSIIVPETKTDYEKRTEYSLGRIQVKAAQLDLKKNRMGYLPNAALYASLSAQAMRNKFDIFDTKQRWYPLNVVGFRIGVPLFDGLQKNYRIQQSKLSLMKAENNVKFIQQSIDVEVTSSAAMLQNALSSVEVQKKNLDLAGEIYRISKLKYDQGVGSNLEVISAESSMKEAQVNYFGALYDLLIAKTDYAKATGTLSK